MEPTVPCGSCGDWLEPHRGFGASVARCEACGVVTVYAGSAEDGDDVTACLSAEEIEATVREMLGRFRSQIGTAGSKAGHQRAVLAALAAAAIS